MLFLQLLQVIFPLLVLVGVGYGLGRKFSIDPKAIGAIILYSLTPFVMFGAVARLELNWRYILLPVIAFAIMATSAILTYNLARLFWKDSTPNLVGMANASGNTSFFAIPVISVLFEPKWLNIYLTLNVGIQLCEATIGYYLAARGNCSMKDSVKRVLSLPSVYAIILGIMVNLLGFQLGDIFAAYWNHALGASIIVGMMMVGLALAYVNFTISTLDYRFLTFVVAIRFLMIPLLVIGFVWADTHIFHLLNKTLNGLLLIIGFVPLPAASVIYASQVGLHVGRMSQAVLLTVLIGMIYLAFFYPLFIDILL